MKHSKKQLQEQQKMTLMHIRAGILSMMEYWERFVEGYKPYKTEALNEITPEKFQEALQHDMLKIDEWLKEYERLDHLVFMEDMGRCTDSIISGKECSICKRMKEDGGGS